jgi:hypothetical protein
VNAIQHVIASDEGAMPREDEGLTA